MKFVSVVVLKAISLALLAEVSAQGQVRGIAHLGKDENRRRKLVTSFNGQHEEVVEVDSTTDGNEEKKKDGKKKAKDCYQADELDLTMASEVMRMDYSHMKEVMEDAEMMGKLGKFFDAVRESSMSQFETELKDEDILNAMMRHDSDNTVSSRRSLEGENPSTALATQYKGKPLIDMEDHEFVAAFYDVYPEGANRQLQLTKINTYTFRNNGNNKLMDVQLDGNGGIQNYAGAIAAPSADGLLPDKQKWELSESASGTFQIKSAVDDGKCLSFITNDCRPGNKIVLFDCVDVPFHYWHLHSDGTITNVGCNNGLVVAESAAGSLILAGNEGTPSMKWTREEYLSNGCIGAIIGVVADILGWILCIILLPLSFSGVVDDLGRAIGRTIVLAHPNWAVNTAPKLARLIGQGTLVNLAIDFGQTLIDVAAVVSVDSLISILQGQIVWYEWLLFGGSVAVSLTATVAAAIASGGASLAITLGGIFIAKAIQIIQTVLAWIDFCDECGSCPSLPQNNPICGVQGATCNELA